MNEDDKLIGQIKLVGLRPSKLYFKVEITAVKRKFGNILAKIKPIGETNTQNYSWVLLSSLKDNI